MELNKGQRRCLHRLIEWWENETDTKQVFEISGAAGTGKTTIIKEMIEVLDDIRMDDVVFITLVGKAALNLSKSGLPGKTIHSTIYMAVEVEKKDKHGNTIMEEGRPVKEIKFVLRSTLENIKLIIIDEASMVNERIARDIKHFDLPIIAIGDLNQLPPVFGDPVFLKHPDAILTEVVRQKAGSPILELAQELIQKKPINLKPGIYGEKLMIIKKDDFMQRYTKALLLADIVICGRNDTRDVLNTMIRKMYYKSQGIPTPSAEIMLGDKLICRKNNWEREVTGINLINGLIGRVTGIDFESATALTLPIDFRPDFIEHDFEDVLVNLRYFNGSRTEKERIKNGPVLGDLFEFGYAITCHLSQGSQYEKVIVFCERMGSEDYYRKWLYTAVTRASDKLILII